MTISTCENCKKEVDSSRSRRAMGRGRFCSHKCRYDAEKKAVVVYINSAAFKVCTECMVAKSISEFHDAPLGLLKKSAKCKSCKKIKYRETYESHRKTPEFIKRLRIWRIASRAKPEVRIAERASGRRRRSTSSLLNKRMSTGIRLSLKGGKKNRSWVSLVPYSFDQLKRHLERQFVPGMGWNNMDEWHIDHVIPVKLFSLSGHADHEFAACWALTNLRPLWKTENQIKHAKRTHLL